MAAKKRRSRRTKKRSQNKLFVKQVAVFVLFLVIGTITIASTNIFTDDYVEIDTIQIIGEDLLIGAECKGMLGGISSERGDLIQIGLDRGVIGRPSIYDVFRDVIEQYEIDLESVRITRIENNHFLSIMSFKTEGKIFNADSRPSDAIALALRTESPIYFNRSFLQEFGEDICPE